MKRRRDGSACHRWRPIASVLCAAALLLAPAEAQPAARHGSGSATYISDVSRAGCGFVSWPRMAETNYAAVLSPSPSRPDSTVAASTRHSRWASACGRCARVWCDDGQLCRGRASSAVVYIVEDQRTRWNNNNNNADLNLSPRVFRSLTGSETGRVPLRWRFTDCPAFHAHSPETPEVPPIPPTATPVIGDEELAECAVCLRNDSSSYLVSLQPVNDTLGVVALRVGGVRAARPWGSPSFFFSLADRFGRLDLTRLEISLTTRSRRRFSRVVAVQPGACVAIRRADEVLAGGGDGGVTPTSRVPPSPESPDDDNDLFEDDDDELYVPTLPPPPPPASRAPSRTSSFVVIPSRAPASAGPSAPLIVVPPLTPPSPAVSPIVRPAVGTVSPSEASPRPPIVPIAPIVPVVPAPTAPPPPAVQVVRTTTPTPVDKDGEWPTRGPSDDADVRTRRPPAATTASPPSAPSAAAPQPTSGGRTPVGHLSGGVLTNPVFVGVLLGTVGLVGAVVAYRAKATQGARLALAPPVTTTAAAGASTSRAASHRSAAATPRADFAAL